MRRALLSLPAAAIVLLLSGCGDPTQAGDAAGGAPVPSTGTPGPPTSAPATPPTTPPTTVPITPPGSAPGGGATKVPVGRQVTIEGVVEAGVEPGCKVLTTPAGQYLILGDQSLGDRVPMGVRVRVTGVLTPGVSTTCQQGTPLRVVSVQRR